MFISDDTQEQIPSNSITGAKDTKYKPVKDFEMTGYFAVRLSAHYGEIGIHEDEGRAVIGYACQIGRWRGPGVAE